MTQTEKNFPEFASEEGEARFWAAQDPADLWDTTQEVSSSEIEIDPELRAKIVERARTKILVSLRLEKRQLDLAKKIAHQKSIPYQTLIRAWVEEGIYKELGISNELEANIVIGTAAPWLPVTPEVWQKGLTQEPQMEEPNIAAISSVKPPAKRALLTGSSLS